MKVNQLKMLLQIQIEMIFGLSALELLTGSICPFKLVLAVFDCFALSPTWQIETWWFRLRCENFFFP